MPVERRHTDAAESAEKYKAFGEDLEIISVNAAEDTVRELMRLRRAQDRATFWMTLLTGVIALATIVLVVLTYVLLADALGWWPLV